MKKRKKPSDGAFESDSYYFREGKSSHNMMRPSEDELLGAFMGLSPGNRFLMDFSGNYLRIDDGCSNLLGINPTDLQHKCIKITHNIKDTESLLDRFYEAKGGRVVSLSNFVRGRDGVTREIEMSLTPIKLGDNYLILGSIKVVRDVGP